MKNKKNTALCIALGIVNGLTVGVVAWLFYLLLKKKHPHEAKSSMLGGAIGMTLCWVCYFNIGIFVVSVAYFALYFTHDAYLRETHGEQGIEPMKPAPSEMQDEVSLLSVRYEEEPSVIEPKRRRKWSFGKILKVLIAPKMLKAIYALYVFVVFIGIHITESYYDYYHDIFNSGALFEFILSSVIPLAVYWVIRLFVYAIKDRHSEKEK